MLPTRTPFAHAGCPWQLLVHCAPLLGATAEQIKACPLRKFCVILLRRTGTQASAASAQCAIWICGVAGARTAFVPPNHQYYIFWCSSKITNPAPDTCNSKSSNSASSGQHAPFPVRPSHPLRLNSRANQKRYECARLLAAPCVNNILLMPSPATAFQRMHNSTCVQSAAT